MRFPVAFVPAFAACLLVAQSDPSATPLRRSTMRPVVRGRAHAVASMKPESTQVAERILRAGGNAFDAAVAGQAVLGIVDAANNGVGSDAELLIYDARAKKAISLNAEGTAPALATIDWYRANQGGKIPVSDTLLSGTVPGVVDAWYTLLDRWGTMTFAEVLAPAIEMAERGFPINDRLAAAIANSKKLRKYPSSERVYFPGGKTWQAGDIASNPDLARTLKRLVQAERAATPKGRRAALKAARDLFYKGDIAREMAAFSEANGGLFRYEDFTRYTVKIEEPVSIDFRGYTVLKNPSATQGPTELFALNILETYDLRGLSHNSADYIHASVEAMKLAMADRDQFLGDMDFIQIPWAGLLSKEYARARRGQIEANKASLEFRPGVPEKFMGIPPLNRPTDINWAGDQGDGGDTSYLVVVDKDRNVVSFEPSLHSGFGTTVVMGELGFSFNCRGDYYSLVPGHANALAPGKRPRSTLQSTLVLKNGAPVMVMGSPGGDDQCMRTMQTFLNMAEFGMNPQQAIEAPRWSTRSFPQSYFPHSMYPGDMAVEDRIPEAVRAELIKRGHKLRVSGPWTYGANAAILIDQATGVLHAGADPRCDAYALAW
jgi:gamma-glutamyltranspeptidase/glutathione hydrolase